MQNKCKMQADTLPMLWHHGCSGHKSCCSNTQTFFWWGPGNLEYCNWSQQQYLLVAIQLLRKPLEPATAVYF